jgi:hypothetical protein
MSAFNPNIDYQILNRNSNLIWAVQSELAQDGTSIVQYQKPSNPAQTNQRFRVQETSPGSGLYYIKTTPAFGNFYVSIDQGRVPRNQNDAGLNIYSQPDAYAVWNFLPTNTTGWFNISPDQASNMYVDVLNDSTSNGAYIIIYTINNQSDQDWCIIPY